tara:strand:- start:7458 stop:8513 length:1056 start_codon:yes stop_codon:yes gene_type:complete
MNEENKTFAEQVVEPTESERIRERISTYKSQVSPQSVQIAQLLLEQQLKAGLVKTSELDALIMLRDDLNKASIDYRTMMESNQKRLQQLAEEEQANLLQKQQEVKKAEEAKLVDERTLRKNLQDKLAIAEAKLEALSGVEGNVAETPSVEIANPQINYGKEEKKPTRAFELARAKNPEPKVSDDAMKRAHEELDEFNAKVEATKKSFKEWEEENGEAMAEGTTTESFLDEVEKVEKESSAPVISKAQVNEEQAENIVADEVDVVEEEEYEEIVIPSRTELNRMKKNQINELAKDFEFSVKMTDTKAVMIDDFLSQVDEYIADLQESGDFVSATTDDEDGDTDNTKDGGYFS